MTGASSTRASGSTASWEGLAPRFGRGSRPESGREENGVGHLTTGRESGNFAGLNRIGPQVALGDWRGGEEHTTQTTEIRQ